MVYLSGLRAKDWWVMHLTAHGIKQTLHDDTVMNVYLYYFCVQFRTLKNA